MSELKISGTITEIYAVENGVSKADKEWKKQSFKIDTKAKFNPDVVFSLFGDKIDLLVNNKKGEEVSVYFNVSSREFNGKFYHNLDAWRIEKADSDTSTPAKAEVAMEQADDLPF